LFKRLINLGNVANLMINMASATNHFKQYSIQLSSPQGLSFPDGKFIKLVLKTIIWGNLKDCLVEMQSK